MTPPYQIADAIVAALCAIPPLAYQMGSEGGSLPNIKAYHDAYPVANSIQHAIRNVPSPGMLVAYMGQDPQGDYERYGHRFSVFMRMKTTGTEDSPLGYDSLVQVMLDGVPTGPNYPEQLTFRLMAVHPNCDPMNAPTWERVTDVDGLDYFQIDLTYTERNGL